jgi:hypothetical protein
MLIIALIASCTAVLRVTLVLGIPLTVLALSALPRTVLQISGSRTGGRRMSLFDKVIEFFVSVAIVLVIGTPAAISFVLVTALLAGGEIDPIFGLVAGIVAACGAGYGGYALVGHAIREWQW